MLDGPDQRARATRAGKQRIEPDVLQSFSGAADEQHATLQGIGAIPQLLQPFAQFRAGDFGEFLQTAQSLLQAAFEIDPHHASTREERFDRSDSVLMVVPTSSKVSRACNNPGGANSSSDSVKSCRKRFTSPDRKASSSRTNRQLVLDDPQRLGALDWHRHRESWRHPSFPRNRSGASGSSRRGTGGFCCSREPSSTSMLQPKDSQEKPKDFLITPQCAARSKGSLDRVLSPVKSTASSLARRRASCARGPSGRDWPELSSSRGPRPDWIISPAQSGGDHQGRGPTLFLFEEPVQDVLGSTLRNEPWATA